MKKAQNIVKAISILIVLMLTLMMFSGCGKKSEKEDKIIKIGIIGSYKSIMENSAEILWGIDLAKTDLERAYKKYNYTVETEFFDDESMWDGPEKQAKKVLSRKDIDAVFVYGSEGDLSGCAEKLSKGDKLTFWLDEEGQNVRITGTEKQFYPVYRMKAQAEAVMKHLSDEGVYSMAMVYNADEYSEHIYDAMVLASKKFGIQITKSVDVKRLDAEEIISSLSNTRPGAVALLCNDGNKNAELIAEVKRELPDAYILSDGSVDCSKILEEYGAILDGTIIPCNVQTNWEADRLKSISDRYSGVYGGKSQLGKITHGYFSTLAIVDAIMTCGTSDAQTLNGYFMSSESNVYKFDDMGDLIYSEIPVLQAKNGVFEVIDTVEFELVDETGL